MADTAVEFNASAPVITLTLMEHFFLRGDDVCTDKPLASVRSEFGGHTIKKE